MGQGGHWRLVFLAKYGRPYFIFQIYCFSCKHPAAIISDWPLYILQDVSNAHVGNHCQWPARPCVNAYAWDGQWCDQSAWSLVLVKNVQFFSALPFLFRLFIVFLGYIYKDKQRLSASEKAEFEAIKYVCVSAVVISVFSSCANKQGNQPFFIWDSSHTLKIGPLRPSPSQKLGQQLYAANLIAWRDAGECGLVIVNSSSLLSHLSPGIHQPSTAAPALPALSSVYIWECRMIIGLLAQFTMLLSYLKTRLRFIRCEG